MKLNAILGLVRFVPRANKNTICIGQPVLPDLDVGVATYAGVTVEVNVFTGTSVLDPGTPTGNFELVERLLSPLSEDEIGTVRCIGLNVGYFTRITEARSSHMTAT
jgi:hypothetical protein